MNNFGKAIFKQYDILFRSHYEPPHLILVKNKAVSFYDRELINVEEPILTKYFNFLLDIFKKRKKKENINELDSLINSRPNTKLLVLRKVSYPDCDVEFIYFGNNISYNVVKNVPVDLETETTEMSEISINLTKEKQSNIYYKFSVDKDGELIEFKENS